MKLCVCLSCWPSRSTVVLLHTLALWTGSVKPSSKVDLLHLAAVTLQENITYWFQCHAAGGDASGPLLLTWYLNGEQQGPPPERCPVGSQQQEVEAARPATRCNSSFSLQASRWHRRLTCVASHPRTGEKYNSTVALDVHLKPGTLTVSLHPSESFPPGLFLLLLALVPSNPPATVTFTDPSGHLVANASGFFTSSESHPWLTNHTLRIMLSGLSGEVSGNGSSGGAAQRNLSLAAEFLQSRVDVPMLGIVTGGVMAFMALLILSLIVLCLMQKNTIKTFDEPVEILMTKKSDSANQEAAEKVVRSNIARENMSLPANMQLHDLNALRKAQEAAQQKSVEERTREEEEDLSVAYAARGFARYPMVGFIYRVKSTSSEEIWL
ncbi:transmembrane protein 25 isoform X1 [Nelusetta ayraudi]|uniref:transmembrane protein 25 isoform X1 n=1 Tax=Nelusetta ayraudi TaxID=303726 RepID=UPI003F6F2A1F